MARTPYVELHAHSAFSFLDGASAPEEMAEAAARMDHAALALTDHDGLCGSLAFAHAARACGVRPITGAELTLRDGSHLTLLAADARGYANLCRLVTIAHRDTRPPPDRRPLPPALDRDALGPHAAGLVCLTGCARHGLVPRLVAAGERRAALQAVRDLARDFGPGNVHVEIQRTMTRGDRRLARDLVRLAEAAGVPAVATGDPHAHAPERALLQDAFVAIRHRLTLDGSEEHRRGNRQAVLRPPAETAARFADHPEAVAQSVRIAERLEFDLTRDLGYRFPDFTGSHPGQTAQEALAALCVHQLGARYPNARRRAAARRRLDEELALIAHHDLAGFFLLHRDILELAREVALTVRPAGSARRWLPPGRGRGSSVGSIVCYLTGLSHIDPVENGLFLGRFLNRDMASVPDIDLDFPRDVRERLIEEVIRRYGHQHAALVAAFPTFRIRMAIRELGAALALPEADIERLARLSDGWSSARAVEEEIVRLPDGAAKLASPRWRALAYLAREAAGLPRHLSQHSGGMVVSARPLVELVPVVPAAFPGRQICQWDKDSCADAGFVKIDLLGLGMLSAVEECVDLVARSRGESVDLSRIGFSDPEVYDEIQDADTVGVFQIESRAQMQSLLQTRPENLDDLTVQVALIRPGPVSGGAVHPYVAHRKALRADPSFEVPYDHPLLAGVLRETLGVVVFQEQVLEVAMALAGFTPGQAEALRRAMSRKRSREAMLDLWRDFRDGARARGVDDETIRTVFTKLVGFSNFGFPKAHSSAFAVLAYQSAWLRRRYPAEFLAALLNAQPMGFYPPASLVRDAQRRGVRVLPPCIARSGALCAMEDGAVRVGLGYVREVRREAAERLVDEREQRGGFRDVADLAARADLRREQLAQLVRSGACDVLGRPRREMLWELGVLARPRAGAGGVQLALPIPAGPAPPLPELTRFERTVTDYETTGLSTGWHLVTLVRPGLPPGTRTAADLRATPDGTRVAVAGMVVARQRPATANGIVFLLLEDETGMVNCIVRPEVYERHRSVVRADPLVLVRGRLERRDRNLNVLVTRLERIEPPAEEALEPAGAAAEMARLRAAAPEGQNFGYGRR
ncbi:DNA polymerase III subunit alpha [Miltoncostaea marina]|uniref:DNA polymerase III subunit alpha n=1 Tax=Miltoncostaea marina TaxID=2843215 RepID=UPI001C3DD058|nr:error-prone DNA polymerase [Miltoncostaea marina]